MATIGQILKEARERKHATLAEAAAVTQIRSSALDDMERDDFRRMPATVYAKGFIRIYGSYLGVDPDPLVREYVRLHTAEGQTRAAADLVAARAAGLPPPEAEPKRPAATEPARPAPEPAPRRAGARPPPAPAEGPARDRPRLRIPQIPAERVFPIVRAVAAVVVAVLLVYGLSQCVRSCSRRNARRTEQTPPPPRETLRLPPELTIVEPPAAPYLDTPAAP